KGLADSVTAASQSAQQVLAATQQQLVGMDQIAGAMRNINQSSTQTMAGARQMERTARDMSSLARSLKALVELNGNGAEAPPASALAGAGRGPMDGDSAR